LPISVSVTADKKVTGSASRLLVDAIGACYDRLGFSAQVADEAFFQMVLARLVEPTSKRDSLRVLGELGVEAVHRNTFFNALKRAQDRDYRDRKSTRLNSSHVSISYAVFCLKK